MAPEVVRHRDELICATTVTRDDRPLAPYLAEIISVVGVLADDAATRGDDDPLVGIEDINPPSPHVRLINPRGLIDTATVIGAVLGRFSADAWVTAVLVPPGGNGSAPLAAYPTVLRPTRGQGKGHDVMRHCRSAWDVAGAAPALHRLENARG